MKFTVSLQKNHQFQHIYKKGKSCGNRHLVVFVEKNELEQNRLGISVSKKMGGAVVRNLLRRRIKEAYRDMEKRLTYGYDIAILPRQGTSCATYQEIVSALRHLMKKQGLWGGSE
ncbi:MAG: ribonuclease P protein component [Defluviitaleaceae bacterium]|nr:ribonuclease P protein component [Defluviitaleaceae bacterium]